MVPRRRPAQPIANREVGFLCPHSDTIEGMRVEGLELTNFRSYARARFELHPDMTLIVGPNASGKTNLLESLYVLAVTKEVPG